MKKNKFLLILTIIILSSIIRVIAANSMGIEWIYPTSNINASQHAFFNISVNISCLDGNCGNINVSLDPIGIGTPAYITPAGAANCSTTYSGSYACSYTNDGATTTGWFSSTERGKEWVYWNLTSTKCVSGIRIFQWEGYSNQVANVDISDNAQTWTTLATSWTISTGGIWNEKNFTESCGNYIRLNFTSLLSYANAKEVLINARNASSSKIGLVSTTTGATPFYTNVSNPYNLTLNANQSQIITWWVNSTDTIGETHQFYVYANQTSNLTISNTTTIINITIKDTTTPRINITYPANMTYNSRITILNYTYYDYNNIGSSCWYSLNSGITNSSAFLAGTNLTNFSSLEGSNSWTIYCNDSSGNTNSNSITFVSTIPVISLDLLSPTTNINVTQNKFFEIRARVSCSNNNCGNINVSLDPIGIGTPAYITPAGAANCTSFYSSSWLCSYSNDGSTGTNWFSKLQNNKDIIFWNLTSTKCVSGIRIYPYSGYSNQVANVDISDNAQTWTTLATSWTISTGGIWNEKNFTESCGNYIRLNFTSLPSYATVAEVLINARNASSSKIGLVSTTTGATPFYTNVSNPYNLTLNNSESAIVSWWVNATDIVNQTHSFFIYANLTSDQFISITTATWNVTILENGTYTFGQDSTYPVFSNYWNNNGTLSDSGIGLFNVTLENTNGNVWLAINNTQVSAINISNVYSAAYTLSSAGVYSYTWNAYGNGSSSLQNTSTTKYYSVIDSCTPSLTNSSWSEWQNQNSCTLSDLQSQNRSKIQYDANLCNEISNVTFYEYQNISCNYCSYNPVNSSWANWINISCLSTNLMNQSRNKTEYDENYNSCYDITHLASDLWNSGNNNTYLEYRHTEACVYDIPVIVSLNYPMDNYQNDSDSEQVEFNCSVSSLARLSNMSLYITDNLNQNFIFNKTKSILGLSNYSSFFLNISGNYTWNCLASDSYGNRSFASSNRTLYVGSLDDDQDGVRNKYDRLNGNKSSIKTSGISGLNVTIGDYINLVNFNDTHKILIYDDDNLILNFSYNFSKSRLNLSEFSIIKSTNSIIVNLSNQLQPEYNKTLYLQDEDFISLCVKDAEISSIDEISSACISNNETDFSSCLANASGVNINGITCTDNGEIISFYNLKYSGVRGTAASIQEEIGPTSGKSSGGGSISFCTTNWTCNPWSFCNANLTQKRVCTKINEKCSALDIQPKQSRACLDILFDVKLDLKPSKIVALDKLRFFIDLKEINLTDLIDIKISYLIFGPNKNKIHEESETIAILGTLSYVKEIPNPDLPIGEYTAQIIVDYGKEQSASSLHPFKVVEKTGMPFYTVFLIIALTLALLVIAYFVYNQYKFRKDEDKIREYLEKLEQEKLAKGEQRLYAPVFKPALENTENVQLELGSQEIDILTLLERVQKDRAIMFVKKFLPYSEFEIAKTISRLKDLGLIEIIKIPQGEFQEEWFYHTSKVDKAILNDDLRFKKDEGWDFRDAANKN